MFIVWLHEWTSEWIIKTKALGPNQAGNEAPWKLPFVDGLFLGKEFCAPAEVWDLVKEHDVLCFYGLSPENFPENVGVLLVVKHAKEIRGIKSIVCNVPVFLLSYTDGVVLNACL